MTGVLLGRGNVGTTRAREDGYLQAEERGLSTSFPHSAQKEPTRLHLDFRFPASFLVSLLVAVISKNYVCLQC